MQTIRDGLILVVKRDCPTCTMLAPAVFRQLDTGGQSLVVYTQDDPSFPWSGVMDDSALEASFHLAIETVPTLIRVQDGEEMERTVGWHRDAWEQISGVADLGPGLPAMQPGCGARNVEPGIAERLQVQYGKTGMAAREIPVAEYADPVEVAYERGWSDGLPVVPPTPERVWRMLQGTSRSPDEVVGIVPPTLTPCTVEKVAINAVMAGCKPEYLPVVLTTVEAACQDQFAMHGLLATTYFSSPIVIVNGPIAQQIGMNARATRCQGNRANATIGRALQLVIRNVGGGLPGGVDRATLGYPGKYTFCFAEREHDSPWESLAVQRGFAPDESTVTLFGGGGVQGVIDQKSREPESLARSLAAALLAVGHPKLAQGIDALLVVSPEHARTFRAGGWSKTRLVEAITEYTTRPGRDLVQGVGGMAVGMPPAVAERSLPKFRPDGLLIVHAGGTAGMFSAIISGWAASGPKGSTPVTVAVRE